MTNAGCIRSCDLQPKGRATLHRESSESLPVARVVAAFTQEVLDWRRAVPARAKPEVGPQSRG